jgi:5-methylcytosine-specific restriction endonuclease McrA
MSHSYDPKLTKLIKEQLRLAYMYWPESPAKQAFTAARVSYGKYLCATCQQLFGPKEVKRDHIDPVEPVDTGHRNWNDHMDRLFFGSIQILCKNCHDKKSALENSHRPKKPRKKKNVPKDN